MRFLLLALLCGLLLHCSSSSRWPSTATTLDASGYLYDPNDKSCDGFPRVQVQTMPGTCLGLVLAQKKAVSNDKPWKMPRTILPVSGSTNEFLVADMGGWAQDRGALYLLRQNSNGGFENVLLKSGLNMPHALRHHANWRMMVLRTFESDNQQNFNYSSVVTLSREDAFKVREILLSAVKQSSDLILNSPEEEVYVMAVDFVKLGRN